MVLLGLALAQAAVPRILDLTCSATLNNRVQRWAFSIDRGAGSYTGNEDGGTSIEGMASIDQSRIILRSDRDQLTWYYHIDRGTGAFTVAGGLQGHDRIFNQARGTCRESA